MTRAVGSVRPARSGRPDEWELRYRGQSKTVRAASETVARRQLAALVAEYRPRPSETHTLAETIEAWIEATAGDKAPRTPYEQRRVAKRHLGALGARDVHKVEGWHLEDHYRALRDEGLSRQTVRHVHNVISGALKWAERRGMVDRNVTVTLSAPVVRRGDLVPVDVKVLARIVAEVERTDDVQARMFMRLAQATGARPGELCGLRWSDVDWYVAGDERGASIVIRRAVTEVPGRGVQIKLPKGTGHSRRLGVPFELRQTMLGYLDWLGGHEAGSYVFPAPSDRLAPDRPSRYSRVWARARERAGVVEPVRMYDLRHAAASILFAQGYSLLEVSRQLGHSNAATTAGVYGHLLSDESQGRGEAIGKGYK